MPNLSAAIAAGVRAIKTAAVLSLLTSIAGLPEVEPEPDEDEGARG